MQVTSAAPAPARPASEVVHVLRDDPDLGRHLEPEAAVIARGHALAQGMRLGRGAWHPPRSAEPGTIGLLLMEGIVAREVALERTNTIELLGPGDLLRPWQGDSENDLFDSRAAWTVLEPVRLALLDRSFVIRVAPWPELFDALIDRTMRRSRRLGLSQAICQLRRVDDRLLVLFVHLADRWGRVSDDGLIVPLRLTQETLGRLVGARRPTVSLALSRLKERGLLVRQPGGWLLTRSPGEPSAGEALGEGEHPA